MSSTDNYIDVPGSEKMVKYTTGTCYDDAGERSDDDLLDRATTSRTCLVKVPRSALGDSAIVGAGQYTDNEVGAAGSTGLKASATFSPRAASRWSTTCAIRRYPHRRLSRGTSSASWRRSPARWIGPNEYLPTAPAIAVVYRCRDQEWRVRCGGDDRVAVRGVRREGRAVGAVRGAVLLMVAPGCHPERSNGEAVAQSKDLGPHATDRQSSEGTGVLRLRALRALRSG